MEANASNDPRPGTTSFRTPAGAAVKCEARESQPGSPLPVPADFASLDELRQVFWQCYRHLFPPHALAAQTPSGSVVISWSMRDDPHAFHPYAAPVMLRFDRDLMTTFGRADTRQRVRIARNLEGTLREGLRGYDPFARFPNARVVVIG
jgi:hypothetical protein